MDFFGAVLTRASSFSPQLMQLSKQLRHISQVMLTKYKVK